MAGRALMSALGVMWAFLAPAHAGAADTQANNQGTAAVTKSALPDEIPAPVAAPRAAQIEPVMVEPVKRVQPKTPEIKTPEIKAPEKKAAIVVTIEKDPTLSEKKSAAAKSSADKKSCGAGQKRNGSGCVKVASNKSSGKKRR